LPQPESDFAARLVAWQQRYGRHDLPWQGTRDPYRIWLSEVMLQQTQVATVIPYYQRFLARFPDVASLAAAAPEEVTAAWAGLGYYSRARNVHRCAQAVVAECGGCFPSAPEALAALPGIGRSTAAAVAAFAWGARAAILDGNVKRVLCRFFAIEGFPDAPAVQRRLWVLAESLLPPGDCGPYSQALMDLGATVCTRRKPACGNCPLRDDCAARRDGRTEALPFPRPRREMPRRETCFVLVTDGEGVLLERRPPGGIWGGLLVPPEGDPAGVLGGLGLAGMPWRPLSALRQTFTHFRLEATPVLCRVTGPLAGVGEAGREWLCRSRVGEAGLPPLFRRLLQRPGRLDEALSDE
jgi:A/G-specific adenine glycosylase